MATGGKSSVQMSDITTCAVCKDTFVEPKALPCMHTFCRQCLDQVYQAQPVIRVPCPMCRKVFTVPLKGIKDLPNNFVILQLLEFNQSTDAQRIKLTIRYCDQHPGQPITVYCNDCRMASCAMCKLMKHKNHNISDVNMVEQRYNERMNDDFENVSAYALKKVQEFQKLDSYERVFANKVSETGNEISKKCNDLITNIQSQKKEMLEELSIINEKVKKRVETKKNELGRQVLTTESFKKDCLERKKAGKACDLFHTGDDLHSRAEELVKTQNEPDGLKLSEVVIAFKPSFSTTNFIGILVLRDATESTSIADAQQFDFKKFFQRLPKLRVILSIGLRVTGLATLGSEVFAVRCTSEVYVYSTVDFSLIRTFTITGSEHLEGIAACSYYNCLYISDNHRDIICRYDLSNNLTSTWAQNGKCFGFFITKSHSVLVSQSNTTRRGLKEYSSDGKLIRVVGLNRNKNRTYHCAQLSTGKYVLCHSKKMFHRVCIVDESGQTIHSYGGLPGLGEGQLNTPLHLAVDARDNVLIADSNNHRVQWLSPTLIHLGDLVIPGHLLNQPSVIHFDELNHRLYIGEGTGGRIFVLEPGGEHQ